MHNRASRLGRARWLALVLPGLAMTAPVAASPSNVAVPHAGAERAALPAVLSSEDRIYYAAAFAALRQADWPRVESLLAWRGDGPLHDVVRSQYYLAPSSPKVTADRLMPVLARSPQLPWAEQLARLALNRGALTVPPLPPTRRLVSLPPAPRRLRPRSSEDGTMPAELARAITERIKNDDPLAARDLLSGIDPLLSPEARAEWRQRVAWSFYIENHDAEALALARSVAQGSGPWVAEGWWTAGLAAWRLNRCADATDAFERAGAYAHNDELGAAGFYWASRAAQRCQFAGKAAGTLRAAAQRSETFYGLLAAEALGVAPPPRTAPQLLPEDGRELQALANVRLARALAELGEDEFAGELLRHQARIGEARQFSALRRLARTLGLASTQLWMAHNAPAGGTPDEASRYPATRWKPGPGWTVDPALVHAHALQESRFRNAAVSPARARGLMQIMPATVLQHCTSLAMDPAAVDLTRPEVNLAFGQRNLEMLRDSRVTEGLLPKVIAAYNAGLGPVARWNGEVRDLGDPLLWIESIPYWETRGYVSVVLRNYWMYEKQAGRGSESRRALARGVWPRFPSLGPVRVAQNQAGQSASARGH